MRPIVLGVLLAIAPAGIAAAQAPPPGLEAALAYPFQTGLVAAERADRIAWINVVKGARNVWSAAGPDYRARRLTDARRFHLNRQVFRFLHLQPDDVCFSGPRNAPLDHYR